MDEHIVNPTRVMYSFRDQAVSALNAITLPTASAPRWIQPNQVEMVEREYIQRVGRVVQDVRLRISAALRKAQAASDSAANYRLVFRQCPIEEWTRP